MGEPRSVREPLVRGMAVLCQGTLHTKSGTNTENVQRWTERRELVLALWD